MPRPKQHHVAGNRENPLRKNAPAWHTSKPDVTKMVRAVEDALKGIAWHDDSQVVQQVNRKRYAMGAGCSVTIESVEET